MGLFALNPFIVGLSLGWLATGVVTSAGLGVAGYRSTARSRHALAWAWLAFVIGSEAYACRAMHAAPRCSMSSAHVESTLLIGSGVGLACAFVAFRLVRVRAWGGPRTTALASLTSGLLVAAFFYAVFRFYGSSLCLPEELYW
jgi:hypothetical protein